MHTSTCKASTPKSMLCRQCTRIVSFGTDPTKVIHRAAVKTSHRSGERTRFTPKRCRSEASQFSQFHTRYDDIPKQRPRVTVYACDQSHWQWHAAQARQFSKKDKSCKAQTTSQVSGMQSRRRGRTSLLPVAASGDRHVNSNQVVAITSGAMVLAAIHRVTFSVLATPFAAEFKMTLPDVGVLQSAALIGYLFGQIPAGVVADRYGGVHVLLTGLLLWSTATGLNPMARYAANPFYTLVAMRVFLGLAQSVMMPSVSSTAAKWVSPKGRGKALSTIYAFSSAGTVLGLVVTPPLAQALGGWPPCFWLFAGLGILWAVLGWLVLPLPSQAPYGSKTMLPPKPSENYSYAHSASSQQGCRPVSRSLSPEDSKFKGVKRISNAGNTAHIVALCWVHSVIGFGFFVLQSWIPAYLTHLGVTDLNRVGLLSGVPWVGTAIASLLAGQATTFMQQRDWHTLKIRTVCQDIATIGPALSLLPLAVASQDCSVPLAVFCLTSTLSLQAFCYAGFHAYIQDVAPEHAGKLLAITNTCGTIVGIAGNILTGNLAASKLGYAAVFGMIGCAYASSFLVWHMCIHGEPVRLGNVGKQLAT